MRRRNLSGRPAALPASSDCPTIATERGANNACARGEEGEFRGPDVIARVYAATRGVTMRGRCRREENVLSPACGQHGRKYATGRHPWQRMSESRSTPKSWAASL